MSDDDFQEPQQVDIKILSDDYPEIMENIEALCVHDNISGRNQFRIKYPDIAAYLYGSELIAFDDDGIGNDEEKLQRRRFLEDEAYTKQQAILDLLHDLADKSIKAGIVQKEFVNKLIETLGVDIIRPLYDEELAAKLFGPAQKSGEAPQEEQKTQERSAEVSQVEVTPEPDMQETPAQTAVQAPAVKHEQPAQVNEAEPPPVLPAPERAEEIMPAPHEQSAPPVETHEQPLQVEKTDQIQQPPEPQSFSSEDTVKQTFEQPTAMPTEPPSVLAEQPPAPPQEEMPEQPPFETIPQKPESGPEEKKEEETPKPAGDISDLEALFGGNQS